MSQNPGSEPAANLTTRDVATMLTRMCDLHEVTPTPDVLPALAKLVTLTLTETPSAEPDSCRWVVTEHDGYCEGRDTLAEALLMAAEGLLATTAPSEVRIAR